MCLCRDVHDIFASRQSSSGCALWVCRTTSDCQFDLHVARFRMLSHRQSSDLLQMKNMMCMQHAMKEKNIASMFVCLCLLPMLLMDCIVLFMCDTAPPAQNSVLLGIDFGSVRCYTMVCRDACAHFLYFPIEIYVKHNMFQPIPTPFRPSPATKNEGNFSVSW